MTERVSARSLLMSRYFNGLAIRYITMPNPRLLQIKKHFILFYFRELTSTIARLESLVQREVENLKENIIKLDKEITRLEKIKNDAITLR